MSCFEIWLTAPCPAAADLPSVASNFMSAPLYHPSSYSPLVPAWLRPPAWSRRHGYLWPARHSPYFAVRHSANRPASQPSSNRLLLCCRLYLLCWLMFAGRLMTRSASWRGDMELMSVVISLNVHLMLQVMYHTATRDPRSEALAVLTGMLASTSTNRTGSNSALARHISASLPLAPS